MAIDSHMHINEKVLKNTDFYINKINNSKLIETAINVGLNIATSKESIEISNKNKKFYSSVGIHPLYIENQNLDELYNLITDKVVAIGEIGLDTNNSNYDEQKKILIKQIMIANELFLIETDSPYISPEPVRDTINESGNIKYIIQKLSEIKNLSFEEFEGITTLNTQKLFRRIK